MKNKNFLKIWLAQIFSLVSAYTLNFILIGRIFTVTQSTVAVSLFLFIFYLPTVLLGPFAGVLIDNISKRKIFFLSNFLQAIIVLTYLGVKDKIWPIYGIVFLYSLCDEFFNPAVGAVIPALVKKQNLAKANSLFFLTGQGSIILGSLIGGLVLKFLSWVDLAFPLVALMLIGAALLSLTLPKEPLRGHKKLKLDFSDLSNLGVALDLNGFWKQTKEGYRFIRHEPLVLFPILLLAGLQSLLVMSLIILPSFAGMLKIEFADSSYLVIIPVILGAILGSLLVSKIIKRFRKNILVLNGLYLMGITILAISLMSLFLKYPLFLALPLIFSLGVSYVLVFVPLQTLIQEATPFDVRGRVFCALNMAVTLTAVLPILVTATLVDFFGLRWILIFGGTFILLLALFAQKKKVMILNLNDKRK